MKTVTTPSRPPSRRLPLPKTRRGLLRLVPLEAIRTQRQYTKARSLGDRLAVLPTPTPDQDAFFVELAGLMETYEEKHFPIGDKPTNGTRPHVLNHAGNR